MKFKVTTQSTWHFFKKVLFHSTQPGRRFVFATEGRQAPGLEPVLLSVEDAIVLAKKHKFLGVVLFAESVHFISDSSFNDVNEPEGLVNDVNLFDKINDAISRGEFFILNGDSHVDELQKTGSLTA